ncbi:hypothetical protein INT47_005984 [Mucor saturninus]|uniref:Caleosin n=1 Tax=Mucor saturninus TaxID=64648 RepID=A0A8H7QQ34_9FUNG|nr:hypothetical protein INT47_005984 [Mucor saturninus]
MNNSSSKMYNSLLAPNTKESSPTEESGIQKHVKFWDKKHKGYITPLDTISGFITLGYGTLFSIAVGTFFGVLLSLSTQKGWFPDPLCRSNVRNLIRAKKETQCNQGAYDSNGLFVPEKFENLFNKYAQSDKSGKTITVTELIRMTKEQERLGKDVKAWAGSMAELCTAYFFIGHRGRLTKEDVLSAYDGTLFYRLRDGHKLMIKQGSVAHINSSGPGLGGSYLASKHSILSVKGIENRVEQLVSALKSKSSVVVNDYRLRNWVSYIQESTETIKNTAIPRSLMRPSTSVISGVTTPKASMYRSTKQEDPATLFPDGITGVSKPGSENPSGPNLSESFFTTSSDDEILSSKETFLFGTQKDESEPKYLQDSTDLVSSSMLDNKSDEFPQLVAPTPKKSISSITSSKPLMNGFLKKESDAHDWLGEGLTGVKGGSHSSSKSDKTPSFMDSNTSNSAFENIGMEKGNPENASSIMVSEIPTKQSPPPPQILQPSPEKNREVPNSVITPPPEEKSVVYNTSAPAISKSNTLNNPKSQKRKTKKTMSSTTSGSESGPETIIQSMNSIKDTPMPIATDAK